MQGLDNSGNGLYLFRSKTTSSTAISVSIARVRSVVRRSTAPVYSKILALTIGSWININIGITISIIARATLSLF